MKAVVSAGVLAVLAGLAGAAAAQVPGARTIQAQPAATGGGDRMLTLRFLDGSTQLRAHQRVETRALEHQGVRPVHGLSGEPEFLMTPMRGVPRELGDTTRLSTTVRFTPGFGELKLGSQLDARKLAQELSRGNHAGRDILLVGFTGSAGTFDVNRRLSSRFAPTVKEALRAGLTCGALDGAGDLGSRRLRADARALQRHARGPGREPTHRGLVPQPATSISPCRRSGWSIAATCRGQAAARRCV